MDKNGPKQNIMISESSHSLQLLKMDGYCHSSHSQCETIISVPAHYYYGFTVTVKTVILLYTNSRYIIVSDVSHSQKLFIRRHKPVAFSVAYIVRAVAGYGSVIEGI